MRSYSLCSGTKVSLLRKWLIACFHFQPRKWIMKWIKDNEMEVDFLVWQTLVRCENEWSKREMKYFQLMEDLILAFGFPFLSFFFFSFPHQDNNKQWLLTLKSSHTMTNTFWFLVMCRSHIGDAQPAHWKISHFCQCVVFRWVCVSIRYSYVESAGPTLCIRCHSLCASGLRRDFCACTKLCVKLDAWMYSPEGRQTRAECARPTPGTRGAHAVYLLSFVHVYSLDVRPVYVLYALYVHPVHSLL